MDLKTGMLVMLIGMVVIWFASEVCAYTYETLARGPDGVGVYDKTCNAGPYDWSTAQWNYQGNGEWWGYSDSSINGWRDNSYSSEKFGVCARAYNSHPKFADQPNKRCSDSDGSYSYAFAGWSSNMRSQQREVYCD